MKTYGTATLEKKQHRWRIEAVPHVMIRVKRVFGGVQKVSSTGAAYLSDTPENARDLEWFCERYPLEIRPMTALKKRSREYKARLDAVESLLTGTLVPTEFDLALPAREYQRTAATMTLTNRSLLLTDEVGLGKTVSAIATFCDARTRPAVVVTLSHLQRQWEREIKRFAPKLRTHIVQQSQPYDLRIGPKARGENATSGGAQVALIEDPLPDVIVLTYHKLYGWYDTLGKIAKMVVFDEAQELRHDGTNRHVAATYLARKCLFRMGLTATPIYNYGAEIFNVLNVISPDTLGTSGEFNRDWCLDGPSIAEPRAFGAYARENGLMLRRTRADVGRELPALSKIPHTIDADEKALDAIKADAAELARIILAQTQEYRGQKMHAAEELSNKLREATGIAKAVHVAAFVRMLVESGEPVVLYGWHRAVYALWLELLAPLKPVLYTGTESPAQKEKSKAAFVSGASKVLIISLRAGAGLDGLQHVCRTVVFGELDWSPGVHEQCAGRVHRDGQAHPVMAYFLVAETGSDPTVADVLGLKQAQSDGMLDPDAELVERLEVDPDKIRKLAEAYLRQRGLARELPAVSVIGGARAPEPTAEARCEEAGLLPDAP